MNLSPPNTELPDGISLRDYYAAQALPACITLYGITPYASARAYQIADYMQQASSYSLELVSLPEMPFNE